MGRSVSLVLLPQGELEVNACNSGVHVSDKLLSLFNPWTIRIYEFASQFFNISTPVYHYVLSLSPSRIKPLAGFTY